MVTVDDRIELFERSLRDAVDEQGASESPGIVESHLQIVIIVFAFYDRIVDVDVLILQPHGYSRIYLSTLVQIHIAVPALRLIELCDPLVYVIGRLVIPEDLKYSPAGHHYDPGEAYHDNVPCHAADAALFVLSCHQFSLIRYRNAFVSAGKNIDHRQHFIHSSRGV